MLRHATLDQLAELKLHGMAKAFEEQLSMADVSELSFEERLGLLVEREATERASRQLTARLRKSQAARAGRHRGHRLAGEAGPRQGADPAPRLVSVDRRASQRAVTGKAGVGKTFLACAFGHKACREGYTVLYLRVPRLFRALAIARGDGSYEKLLRSDTPRRPCSSSMTGVWRRSGRPSVAICSRSSRIATGRARRSWPRNCQSRAGTRSLATRRSPTPSSIASSTTPTGWRWRVTPCARTGAPTPRPPPKEDPPNSEALTGRRSDDLSGRRAPHRPGRIGDRRGCGGCRVCWKSLRDSHSRSENAPRPTTRVSRSHAQPRRRR